MGELIPNEEPPAAAAAPSSKEVAVEEADRPTRLVRAVVERPVSVSIAALALVVLGLVSLWRLPVSLLPSLERPGLEVRVVDTDLGRQQLLEAIVRPLERSFASLPGVLDVSSRVADGEATLTVGTEWQTDVDRLRIDAERRLAGAGIASVDELTVRTSSGDAEPILRIAVVGGAGAAARTEYAESVLVPELGRLSGAGEVRLTGGARLQAVVRPRAADLAARGLTAADVRRRMERVGRDVPLGTVRDGGKERPLVVSEPLRHLDELARLRIDVPGRSRKVLLGDVADLRLEEVPSGTVARWIRPAEGSSTDESVRDVVLVDLHRAPGANAVLLARAARKALVELSQRSDTRLQLHVVRDASAEVVSALGRLGQAALLGLLLGTLVLRVLLGQWRPTLSLAIVVPASLVAAFGAFLLGGISLDLVSLAGLALAAGMLVDNSVVVLEAITSSRERGHEAPVIEGTRQIAMALVASFLTTAVVFLPLIYLRGLARAFFGVQAFAIVSSLAISLVLSLSLTPVLARSRRAAPVRGRSPGRGLYLRLLDGVLARPVWTLVLTSALLAVAGWLVLRLPAELVPAENTDGLRAELRLEPGLDRAVAGERLDRLLVSLAETGLAGERLATYRADEIHGRPAGSGELDWTFQGSRTAAVPRIQVPGVEADLTPRRGAVSAAVERSGRSLRVEVSASTPERAEALGRRVLGELADRGLSASPVRRDGAPVRGLVGHQSSYYLNWLPLRLAARAELAELTGQVQAGLGGIDVGRVEIEGVQPALRLEATATDLDLLPVRSRTEAEESRIVPLSAVADTGLDFRPPADERRNGRPTFLLELPRGTDVARLETILAGLSLAAEEKVNLAGETRELRRAFRQLRLALALALVLVFLTVAALYESLSLPFAVMTTVPVAGAGAVAALAATGGSLNVMSFLGVILLTGIVVNNGIVLIHRVEQLWKNGLPLREALREGAAERYRPILMTTLTTLLGMLPLAFLGGDGAELRRSLATAVCGGLTTSWAGALLVVPVFYVLLRREPSRGAGG
ncbi:MAG: efflux RND transporter permease subunit [Thermoanaerobaculia bacterium]|nr:efflux RND transporter permease subunit [Thermoanaerobaculia bacterium]